MSIFNRSGKGVSSLDTLGGDVRLKGYNIAIEDDPDTGTIGLRNSSAAPTLEIVLNEGNKTSLTAEFKQNLSDTYSRLKISQAGLSIGDGTADPTPLILRNPDGTSLVSTRSLMATSANIGTITTNTEMVTGSISTPVLNGNLDISIVSDNVQVVPKTLGATQTLSTTGNFSANNATIATQLTSRNVITDQITSTDTLRGLALIAGNKIDLSANNVNLLNSTTDINAYSLNLNGSAGRTEPTTINASAGSTLVIDNVNSSSGTNPIQFNVGINTTDLTCTGDISGDNLAVNTFTAQELTTSTLNVNQILPTNNIVSVPAWLATNMLTATRGDINDLRTGYVTPTNGPTVGFHGGIGTPNIVAYDAANITVSDDMMVLKGKTLTAPTLKSATIGTVTGDLTISPTGTNVVIDTGKALQNSTISTASGDLAITPTGSNVVVDSAKTLQVSTIAAGSGDITVALPFGNINLNPVNFVSISRGPLVVNEIDTRTLTDDLVLAPGNSVTVANNKQLNVNTIGTAAGNDLVLNPSSNVTIGTGSDKSLKVAQITTGGTSDLTLAPAGSNVVVDSAKKLSVKNIISAGTDDLTITPGGSNVVVDPAKKLSVKNIISAGTDDLTITPGGNYVNVASGKTLVVPTISTGAIGTASGDLTLSPTNNVTIVAGKALNVNAIGTAVGDLTLSPANNVVVDSAKKLSVKNIISAGTDNLTITPGGSNVVVDSSKKLSVKNIISAGTDNITITPGGSSVIIDSDKVLYVDTIVTTSFLRLLSSTSISLQGDVYIFAGRTLYIDKITSSTGGNIVIDSAKNLSVKNIISAGTDDLTIAPGGSNLVVDSAKKLSVKNIISAGTDDLTITPSGNNVVIEATKKLSTKNIISAGTDDLTITPGGSNLVVDSTKNLSVKNIISAGTDDLTITPGGSNLVVDSAKKLSVKNIISAGTDNLTITPGGSNVIIDSAKTLQASTIGTASGDLILNPAGNNVVVGTGKALQTTTINTAAGDLYLSPAGSYVAMDSSKTLSCCNIISTNGLSLDLANSANGISIGSSSGPSTYTPTISLPSPLSNMAITTKKAGSALTIKSNVSATKDVILKTDGTADQVQITATNGLLIKDNSTPTYSNTEAIKYNVGGSIDNFTFYINGTPSNIVGTNVDYGRTGNNCFVSVTNSFLLGLPRVTTATAGSYIEFNVPVDYSAAASRVGCGVMFINSTTVSCTCQVNGSSLRLIIVFDTSIPTLSTVVIPSIYWRARST